MWLLDNSALPIDSDRFTEDSVGISLFLTNGPRANQEPQFYSADPQATYSTITPPTFDSVIEDTPIPTDSVIYQYRGLVEPTNFTEAPTLFYLDNNKFFFDYIDAATYVVVDAASSSVSLSFSKDYDYFSFESISVNEDLVYTLDLSQEDFSFSDISNIDVGGLVYSKVLSTPTSAGEFFFDTTNQQLTIRTSTTCGPSQNVDFSISFSLNENDVEDTYKALRFDFSSSSFDYIDFVSYQNLSYYPSAEISSGTLIYNRIDKIGLCLL